MTGTIIPLRSKDEETSALAHFDVLAAELLTEGRAASLSAAWLDAILTELHRNRVQLCAVMEDQHRSGLAAHAQFGGLATGIRAVANQTLARIDQLIEFAELRLSDLPVTDGRDDHSRSPNEEMLQNNLSRAVYRVETAGT